MRVLQPPTAALSSLNGKRCLALGTPEFAAIWFASLKFCDRLPNFEDASDRLLKWVFLIFPPLRSAPNPPTSQSFSFFLCFFGLFPTLGFISIPPSPPLSLCPSLSSAPCLPCLPLSLPSLDFASDPCYLVLEPFHRNEQIGWSMLSLLLQHTNTLTLTPNWHEAQRSTRCSRLPTNYYTVSTTLPPVSTPHLCASDSQSIHVLLPLRPTLRTVCFYHL